MRIGAPRYVVVASLHDGDFHKLAYWSRKLLLPMRAMHSTFYHADTYDDALLMAEIIKSVSRNVGIYEMWSIPIDWEKARDLLIKRELAIGRG
ncbi:MAG: hypothetical protein QXH97_00325 [Candidatus Bathyarchaeia archaeon]